MGCHWHQWIYVHVSPPRRQLSVLLDLDGEWNVPLVRSTDDIHDDGTLDELSQPDRPAGFSAAAPSASAPILRVRRSTSCSRIRWTTRRHHGRAAGGRNGSRECHGGRDPESPSDAQARGSSRRLQEHVDANDVKSDPMRSCQAWRRSPTCGDSRGGSYDEFDR
jgi:hypothetical protein